MIHNISPTLLRKMGIKQGDRIKVINEPENYFKLFGTIPDNIKIQKVLAEPVDFIHLFAKSQRELSVEVPVFKNYLGLEGCLWISCPKPTSNIVSDLDEDTVKEIGSNNGLVYETVCSVDKDWNAFKFINGKRR